MRAAVSCKPRQRHAEEAMSRLWRELLLGQKPPLRILRTLAPSGADRMADVIDPRDGRRYQITLSISGRDWP